MKELRMGAVRTDHDSPIEAELDVWESDLDGAVRELLQCREGLRRVEEDVKRRFLDSDVFESGDIYRTRDYVAIKSLNPCTGEPDVLFVSGYIIVGTLPEDDDDGWDAVESVFVEEDGIPF
jgi:hypothetical protein